MKITLYPGDDAPTVLSEDLYNKDTSYTLSYTYTYPDPLQSTSLTVCVSNTQLEQCSEFQNKITVVKRVEQPTIPLPDFIERGQVLTLESDVVADNYLWTHNNPKVDMILTPSGLKFPENFDSSTNNEASYKFYPKTIGTLTIGQYVYNMLSWQYTEKTVYVESLVGNVPVRFVPDEYATTSQPVNLVISCPTTSYQNISIKTTDEETTVECLRETVDFTLTFSSPGEQLVEVTTYNNISSSEETYTIIVQDVVDVVFSVASVGISPNTSVAVGSVVSFVATSGAEFVPQPDLVVSWNVSDVLVTKHMLSDTDPVLISSVSYLFNEV